MENGVETDGDPPAGVKVENAVKKELDVCRDRLENTDDVETDGDPPAGVEVEVAVKKGIDLCRDQLESTDETTEEPGSTSMRKLVPEAPMDGEQEDRVRLESQSDNAEANGEESLLLEDPDCVRRESRSGSDDEEECLLLLEDSDEDSVGGDHETSNQTSRVAHSASEGPVSPTNLNAEAAHTLRTAGDEVGIMAEQEGGNRDGQDRATKDEVTRTSKDILTEAVISVGVENGFADDLTDGNAADGSGDSGKGEAVTRNESADTVTALGNREGSEEPDGSSGSREGKIEDPPPPPDESILRSESQRESVSEPDGPQFAKSLVVRERFPADSPSNETAAAVSSVARAAEAGSAVRGKPGMESKRRREPVVVDVIMLSSDEEADGDDGGSTSGGVHSSSGGRTRMKEEPDRPVRNQILAISSKATGHASLDGPSSPSGLTSTASIPSKTKEEDVTAAKTSGVKRPLENGVLDAEKRTKLAKTLQTSTPKGAQASALPSTSKVDGMVIEALSKQLIKLDVLSTFHHTDSLAKEVESGKERLRRMLFEMQVIKDSMEKTAKELKSRNAGYRAVTSLTRSVSLRVTASAILAANQKAEQGCGGRILTPRPWRPQEENAVEGLVNSQGASQVTAFPVATRTSQSTMSAGVQAGGSLRVSRLTNPPPASVIRMSTPAAPQSFQILRFPTQAHSTVPILRGSRPVGIRQILRVRAPGPAGDVLRPANASSMVQLSVGPGRKSPLDASTFAQVTGTPVPKPLGASSASADAELVDLTDDDGPPPVPSPPPASALHGGSTMTQDGPLAQGVPDNCPPLPQDGDMLLSCLPAPTLCLGTNGDGLLTLTWNIEDSDRHTVDDIAEYEVYACLTPDDPSSTWDVLDTINAQALPIVCTLTEHEEERFFTFAVRGVRFEQSATIGGRKFPGPFSNVVCTRNL